MLTGALIGCGYIAPRHAVAWNAQTDAELAAVVDLDRERARSFAARYGIALAYTSLEELLEERGDQLDFVDICLPPDLHEPVMMRALDAGLHVLCQKPMSDTLDGTRRMVAAVNASPLTVGINEIWKWMPAYNQIQGLLEGGAIGAVEHVTFRGCSNLLLPRATGEPVSDTYDRFSRMDRLVILEYGVHVLDLVRTWFGEPAALSARTARTHPFIVGDDAARIHLAYPGLEVEVELDFSFPGPATLDNLVGESVAIRGSDGLVTSHGARTVELVTTSVHERWDHTVDQRAAGFEGSHRDFAVAVRDGRRPASHPGDNVRSSALVLASYHSAERGGEPIQSPSDFLVGAG